MTADSKVGLFGPEANGNYTNSVPSSLPHPSLLLDIVMCAPKWDTGQRNLIAIIPHIMCDVKDCKTYSK